MVIHMNWFEAKGDDTLALDWPLNENSHVWEIGGYEGRWAQQIWDKYHCNLTIFEPQIWAVERMQSKFAGIEKIDIRPYGLWHQTKVLPIADFYTDGASIMRGNLNPNAGNGTGAFRNYGKEIDGFRPNIDVCLMNVEGAEYELIPGLIGAKLIKRFKYFWCQFHPTDLNDDRHVRIFEDMQMTHEVFWDSFPTAIAWRRKDG